MHPLETKLAAAWPPADWADVTVLVAISGGCDSVALLRALAALKTGGPGRLVAAHLNHQLRPEANDDERFVVELCRRLGIACETQRITIAPAGDGLEAAARAARYHFLEQAAARAGARWIVTAHTADDQAETILHRIVRGTGVRGLSGMARSRPLGHAALIRPLLETRRAELHRYLADLEQPYRCDASNSDPSFTRNRIRHEAMPMLQERFNPDVVSALLRLGALAGQMQSVVDQWVEERFDRCVAVENAQAATVALVPLAHCPDYLVRELFICLWRRQGWPLQAMSRRRWEELAAMARTALSAKHTLPGNVLVEVVSGRMRLSRSIP